MVKSCKFQIYSFVFYCFDFLKYFIVFISYVNLVFMIFYFLHMWSWWGWKDTQNIVQMAQNRCRINTEAFRAFAKKCMICVLYINRWNHPKHRTEIVLWPREMFNGKLSEDFNLRNDFYNDLCKYRCNVNVSLRFLTSLTLWTIHYPAECC